MANRKKIYATHVSLPNGERKYVKANSENELKSKIAELKRNYELGLTAVPQTTFSDYAQLWLQTYKPQSSLRPTSYQAICNTLDNHILPFFGTMQIDKIKPMQVRQFLNSESHFAKETQRKTWMMLKNIFATAVDNHIISESPIKSTDKLPPCPSKPQEEPLTDDQVARLLGVAEGHSIYTFILLALGAGLRRGEILGLMWDDVDLDGKTIHVRHNKALAQRDNDSAVSEMLKTDAGRRNIPIPTKLCDYLTELKKNSKSKFVFAMTNGNSYTKSAFTSAWRVINRRTVGGGEVPRVLGETYGKLTVELDFHTHPHQLRHTYITKLFEQGLDIKQVQYLAGHATPDMTLRVYTHFRQRQRNDETQQQVIAAIDYL